ncbi:MAG: bifunctional glutamate N-acetyltransferase/amino-acid acetyltransferase ArgJ [Nitrospirota bacterium]
MIPQGFLFSAAEAAIKKPGRKDLALIYSTTEATVAGRFTTNNVKAAPVKLDMKNIKEGRGQAIIVNSGNANACTGRMGMEDAREMASLVARRLRMKSSRIFVCSTGVIGTPMPMERIRPGIDTLAENLGKASLEDVAGAIMTTDTFPKIVLKKVKIGKKTGRIAGICKGAGMISPHMATMLCFVMTDIAIDRHALDSALGEAVRKSFHRITIDGDMSTNDTVLVMANGILGNEEISRNSPHFAVFRDALSGVTYELSKLIAMDGEGATKLVEIEVVGAGSESDAGKAAFAVANSNLVKTALYGNDANWGRIMAALGYSGARMKEENVDIYFGRVKMVSKGIMTGRDKEAGGILRQKHVKIIINLRIGKASAKVLTCDLTEKYVRVNAEYRT